MAAVLAGGRGAVLSHRSAAALWGLCASGVRAGGRHRPAPAPPARGHPLPREPPAARRDRQARRHPRHERPANAARPRRPPHPAPFGTSPERGRGAAARGIASPSTTSSPAIPAVPAHATCAPRSRAGGPERDRHQERARGAASSSCSTPAGLPRPEVNVTLGAAGAPARGGLPLAASAARGRAGQPHLPPALSRPSSRTAERDRALHHRRVARHAGYLAPAGERAAGADCRPPPSPRRPPAVRLAA